MFLGKIKKRDGQIVDFDPLRIKNAVHKAFIAVELEDGDKAAAVTEEVVKVVQERFQAQIPSVEDVQDVVIDVLRKKGYDRVAQSYKDFRKKKEELRTLRQVLGITPKLSVNAIEVLKARYLLRDEHGNIVETPEQLFKRVARAVARADNAYGDDAGASEKTFYEMMARLEFLPNTPTLFNAGTEIGQLSACFVLPVEDSLESIFTAVKNMALIEQTGGGVGFNFSRLRPRGDIVKSTKGVASGPVSFMRVFDTATEVIKAGGKRRGAMMGILRVDHPDILEFILAKQNPQFLSNFNISVAVTDEFMQAVSGDEEYWLTNPRNNEKTKPLKAREAWRLIARSAWASGDPGVVFIDEVNRHNPTPHVGRIESTNPCVTADTWVMTADGPRKVKELVGHAFVAIVNGGKWSSSPVGFFSTGVKQVCSLKSKEGFEVKLTSNHMVLRLKTVWKQAAELEWVEVANLKPGDCVLLNNYRNADDWPSCSIREASYDESFPAECPKHSSGKVLLSTCANGQASNSSSEEALISTKLACTNLNAGHAAELFLKASSEDALGEFEKTPASFYQAFLACLFNKAGSIHVTESGDLEVRLNLDRVSAVKVVQRMLLRLGIVAVAQTSSKLEREPLCCNSFHRGERHRLGGLVISGDNVEAFARKIGFTSIHRQVLVEKLVETCKARTAVEPFVAFVEEVVPAGEEEVYDVVIPGINAFDANGFLVHNCGEQPLLPYESCNLGSINLAKMVYNGKVDWGKLRLTVRNAVHFLDNVIDVNVFPLKEIGEITRANRKVGLGVMGFADMLILLGIPYDSEEALQCGEQVMRFIQEEAHEASREMGEQRGSFPNFEGSIWQAKYSAMRNATVTTVAPTGTISIIAGCSSGIEPLFAISFMRNVLGGARLFETNQLFEETAKQREFYSGELLEKIARTGSVKNIESVPEDVKRLFVTALDIAPEWHVRMQAVFQKHTDNAVSKTVNLPNHATVEDVQAVYDLAWKLKCKGVTVFRYGSKPEQVLYIGEIKTSQGVFLSAQPEYAGGCPTMNCPFPA
jgi:ribonucleoside-diphosphate reductase alpha chain